MRPKIKKGEGLVGVVGVLFGALALTVLGHAVASSQGADAAETKEGKSFMIVVGADEKGWEPRVRTELERVGYPDPDQVVDRLKANQTQLTFDYAHRNLYVSTAPAPLFRSAPDAFDNDTSYCGCTVGQWGNALLNVYDPTAVIVYWSGLKIIPPFSYLAGPLFETCGSYACTFVTGHQGTTHFSHSVSATVDTDMDIAATWCGG